MVDKLVNGTQSVQKCFWTVHVATNAVTGQSRTAGTALSGHLQISVNTFLLGCKQIQNQPSYTRPRMSKSWFTSTPLRVSETEDEQRYKHTRPV